MSTANACERCFTRGSQAFLEPDGWLRFIAPSHCPSPFIFHRSSFAVHRSMFIAQKIWQSSWLQSLGYILHFDRSMSMWKNFALGFT